MTEKGTVFFPDPDLIGTPADVHLDYKEIWFTAVDGVPPARLVDPPTRLPDRPVVSRQRWQYQPPPGKSCLTIPTGSGPDLYLRLPGIRPLRRRHHPGRHLSRCRRGLSICHHRIKHTRGRPGPFRPLPGHRPGPGSGR